MQYTRQGDYFLPNLLPPQEETCPIGKYGIRLRYLKEHRRILYTNLLISGKLQEYLVQVEEAAQNRMEFFTRQMAKAQGGDRRDQSQPPDGMGGTDKQYLQCGRGNHSERTDLRMKIPSTTFALQTITFLYKGNHWLVKWYKRKSCR